MIDWQRVLDLRDEVGPDEFQPVLDLFIDEVEHMLMQLTPNDAAQFEGALHFLKGSAWNLGFAEFGARCQTAEKETRCGNLRNVSIEDLVTCYSLSKQAFVRDLDGVVSRGPARGADVA